VSKLAPLARLRRLPPRASPPGILVGDIAETSRAALVAFLRPKGAAVERSQLAAWLFGPYLDALEIGRASALVEPSFVLDDILRTETADAAVARATRAIEQVLRAFSEDPDPTIATRLVERRVVEGVVDERGSSGFVPLGEPWMTLGVRVLALVGVEMLTRPDRFRADIVVTERSVEIADRAVISGVGIRGRRTLPWRPSADERDRAPGWPAVAPTLAELVAAQDRETDGDD
jgi:hypothetical protein